VGLIGHSEGGGVAPIVSLQAKTDFLILMAAANATANESLVYQTRARLKDMDVNEKTSEEIIVTLDSLLAIAKSEPDALRAKMKMDDLIARTDQTASEDYKTTAQRLGDVNWLIDGFLDPKFRYRLRNDPKDEFKKVRIPVLVLYGDGDKLVDVGTNLPLIKTAFDSTACDIKVFPGLGHLFMNGNVSMEELHEIEETIDPQVLATISDWILR
jgi:pimeloyl-ACP methyl ester carboxylesterase